VLSFLVPGLGQIFKGHVGRGLMLFTLTLIGYAIFILPGIIIHVLTVLDAGSEKKWLA
jgi:TM2 domain-containing membrane protein YozV